MSEEEEAVQKLDYGPIKAHELEFVMDGGMDTATCQCGATKSGRAWNRKGFMYWYARHILDAR